MTPARLQPNEDEFEDSVVELAHTLHWHVAAFRPARRLDGSWETPCKHDAQGWPDLTLVRDRTIHAELKSARGRLSVHQERWLERLRAAGSEVYVWRPDDWDEIAAVLTRRQPHRDG